jgi:DNA polymerase III subunit beta
MTAVLTDQLACTVDQAAFKAAVAAAAKRLPSRPALPLLACIRLDLSGDRMTVNAFDHEVSLSAVLSADGRGDGSVAVSGRLLSALVDTLPAKPVHLAVEGDRLKLACGTVKLGFPTMSIDDYPALPQLPPQVGTVDATVLARAVKRVAVATGPDATPVELIGMWLQFGDDLLLAASDRYRAAKTTAAWQRTGRHADDAVVAAHVLADVAPTLTGEVTVHADGTLFGLTSGDITVVASQIGGKHPKAGLLRFFETEGVHVVTVDSAEFVEHLSRANKVHEKTSPIILSFSDGEVSIRATAEDTTDADAAMDCTLDGEPIEIRVNPTFLIDAVRACAAAQVVMPIVAPSKPFQVQPVGDDDYRHVVVPIRQDKAGR